MLKHIRRPACAARDRRQTNYSLAREKIARESNNNHWPRESIIDRPEVELGVVLSDEAIKTTTRSGWEAGTVGREGKSGEARRVSAEIPKTLKPKTPFYREVQGGRRYTLLLSRLSPSSREAAVTKKVDKLRPRADFVAARREFTPSGDDRDAR